MTSSVPGGYHSERTGSTPDRTSSQLVVIGNSRGWTVAFGVLTLVAGILLLVWPGLSVFMLAVVLGSWLLVAGLFRLIAAIALTDQQATSRVLMALLAAVAILVGILVLARPLQTATALALLVGAFWVIGGIIEAFHGIVGETSGRVWAIVAGVVSVVAGAVVLAYPGASLLVLTWLFGIFLIVLGVISLVAGFAGGPGPAHRASGAPGPVPT